jgi:hypothetical protein
MAMIKLFTLERATTLLPVVEARIAALQVAVHDTAALRAATAAVRPGSVTARNLMQEMTFVVNAAHDAKAELDRLGVVVTDLEAGQVAFPAQVGGELVSLTWRRGDDAITHYRRIVGDEGVLAPEQPLERLAGATGAT